MKRSFIFAAVLAVLYLMMLLINILKVPILAMFLNVFLFPMIPEFISWWISFPIFFLASIHFILFVKNKNLAKNDKILRIIILIIIYTNISLTVYWVTKVQSKINTGHRIIKEIDEYYEVNKKYPASIELTTLLPSIHEKTKYGNEVYQYRCSNDGTWFTLDIYPEEFDWEHLVYTSKGKEFMFDD